ncbi:hypothetical protein PIB30_084969 [Stylosanthes scabra]|uniref:Uncharacterized protein n=1 Tax=Stylosanthes scabra TaxID=79078 RepID=A0ABU6RT37_9FABA|nr:hypothetical protein [Stylosanthes scabra]
MVRHWWLVGAGRITHQLGAAQQVHEFCGRVMWLRGTVLGRGVVTPRVPARLVQEGVSWVSPAFISVACVYVELELYLRGKNSNKPRKGTSNMAGKGEKQLERDADINRLDRTHHVAGAIGF